MKKYIKLLITVILLVVLIAGAVVLYNNLSEDYIKNQETEIPKESEPLAETEETQEISESESLVDTEDATPKPVLELPDSTFYDMNGNRVNLSDFVGKPMIVNFWATWCGPCKNEMPHFQKMYEKYGDRIEFIMINATDGERDTVSVVQKYISNNGYTFPVYCDTDLDAINTYGVYAFPSTLIINADGSIFDARVGAFTESQLQAYIDALLGIN